MWSHNAPWHIAHGMDPGQHPFPLFLLFLLSILTFFFFFFFFQQKWLP
jgi:hypothetical protein